MMRKKLQDEALDGLYNYKSLILEWCTGLGKTKVALECIRMVSGKYTSEDFSVLILLAETSHKQNWIDEFEKWGMEEYLKYVTLECYHSLHKHLGKKYKLVIYDEAHHLSEARIITAASIEVEYMVALSATLPSEVKRRLSSLYGRGFQSAVSLSDAIDGGILPKPKVLVVPLTLDDKWTTEEIVIEWGLKSKREDYTFHYSGPSSIIQARRGSTAGRAVARVTPFQKYSYLESQVNYWWKRFLKTNADRDKNNWLMAGLNRKQFLGEQKSSLVVPILAKLEHLKYVCFCASIRQAEYFSPDTCIHSKRKDSLERINSFNKGTIKTLFPVGMLQEGNNLEGIEAGIIVQFDGKTRGFIQKMGRTMRADNPLQILFYYKGTRDEEYIQGALRDFNADYYRIVEYEELISNEDLFR